VAITAITRTPKLAQCDQASFFGALLTLSQYGIEPDGRRAHLIPFENRKRGVTECQLIIDYKGLAELAMRSGLVSYLHADTVCEHDQFEVNLGEITKHVVDYRKPRGEVYAAYAVCRFKDGATKAEVMTRDEVEAIRKRSRAGTSGPWVTDWAEMAKKTAFRRLSKWLPLSADLRQAIEVDDDQFADMKRANLTATDTPMNPFALPAEAVADEVEVVEGGAQ
jgi:recombination protein RecT